MIDRKGLIETKILLFVFKTFKDSMPQDRLKLVREIAHLAEEIESYLALGKSRLAELEDDGYFEETPKKMGLSSGL